jgi:hypothetical protein
MFPLIYHIRDFDEELYLSVWIINMLERFRPFRLSYFGGASHIVLLTNDLENEFLEDNLISSIPQAIPISQFRKTKQKFEKNVSKFERNIQVNDEEKQISVYHFNSLKQLPRLFNEIGRQILQTIINGSYTTFSPSEWQYASKKAFIDSEKFQRLTEIIEHLGCEINEEGIVRIEQNPFVFFVDFYKNEIKASMSKCEKCSSSCKQIKKLCVIEDEEGFATIPDFNCLKALGAVYAIKSKSFLELKGKKVSEDITYQLNSLKRSFLFNCPQKKKEL